MVQPADRSRKEYLQFERQLPEPRGSRTQLFHTPHPLKADKIQYWSEGKACFIPSALGDLVVVPPAELKWLLEQPDATLSNQMQLQDILQTHHTMMDARLISSNFSNKLISRTLTSQLGELSGAIYEEIASSVDQLFGSAPGQYRDVNVFEAATKVVARTTNRVFVGIPLCRNDKLINHLIDFSEFGSPCLL